MRTTFLATVLLAATACSSGSTPSAAPTTEPTAQAPAGLQVAVATAEGLGIYRIGSDRKAVLLRALEAPGGTETPVDVALSGQESCAVWAGDIDGGSAEVVELRCYAAGDTTGVDVDVVGRPAQVALRDGQVAWTEYPDPDVDSDEGQQLVTADVTGGVVGQVDRRPVGKPDLDCAAVSGLAWAGDRLLAECEGANDDPGGLQVVGTRAQVPDGTVPPYTSLTQVESADATTALAVQGEHCEITCPDGKAPEPRRAVRVSLSTGAVVEVVSTPATGRYVSGVSGGAAGVVYVTRGADFQDVRVYLRLPAESRGTLVSGLPAGVRDVVASA